MPQAILSAALIASRSAVSLNGFDKHSTAPCSRRCNLVASSPRAVMKTIGILRPRRLSSCCSSGPDMPGMATSRIRHFVCSSALDWRNSSAEENAAGEKPNSLSKSGSDSRTDSSSSTMETSGRLGSSIPMADHDERSNCATNVNAGPASGHPADRTGRVAPRSSFPVESTMIARDLRYPPIVFPSFDIT